ncbi:neocarzinostatin apoprotein domain-containing protein [Amycolatopsis sp. NPDC059027]|uniref:neocarzinostatin apoprotein domain-containing protein n=1 Tax=Amycolatopsis sp. NPDC059027 TaxID=3346709 RepID=UPI00366F6553
MISTKRTVKWVTLAAVSVASATLLGGTAAAQSPSATLTVTPSTNLDPEQQVSVSVSDMTPNRQIILVECSADGRCYLIGGPVTDGSGNVSATVTVYRHMSWGENDNYDCNTPGGGCYVAASDPDTGELPKVPISFR